MSLAELIKQTRLRASLSPQEFATQLHVGLSTVHHWENGRAIPSTRSMCSIRLFCKRKRLPFKHLVDEWLKARYDGKK